MTIKYLLPLIGISVASGAVVISEFEPNPAGSDPNPATVELAGGTSGTSFDYWLISLENDGYNGTVDRVSNILGTFDSNGLAQVLIPDLENPTFTVILTDSFTGGQGDDLDPDNDGNLELSSLGTIIDAVGISDSANDDAVLYGADLGGSNILYNGEFEPLLVFRDGSTGDWYQTVTVDFGDPTQHVGIFAATGGSEIDKANFSSDPTIGPNYGATNPVFVGVPEPSTGVLGLFGMLLMFARRR